MLKSRKQAEWIRDIAIVARLVLAEALRPVLMGQVREAAREVESGATPGALAEHQAAWERQLMGAKLAFAVEFAVDGYRLGEAALGKSAGIAELCGKADVSYYLDATGLHVEAVAPADALISRRIGQKVGRYVEETSRLETATSIDRLNAIFTRDVAENKTVAQIARDFLDEGASWVDGQGRANLMARTMSQWAYNHGSMEAYADAGAKSEWLASTDACPEICWPLNTVVADAGGIFNGPNGPQTYPGHPNCQCAVIPHLGAA